MRYINSLTCACALWVPLYGQQTWTFEGTGEHPGLQAVITDVVETAASGFLMGTSVHANNSPPGQWQGHLLQLDAQGQMVATRKLWDDPGFVFSITSIHEDESTGGWLIFGHLRDDVQTPGIGTYRCDADLTPLDSSHHFFPDLVHVSLTNVTRDTDGSYLVMTAGRGSSQFPDRMILMRFNPLGQLVDEHTIVLTIPPPPYAPPFILPRHAIPMDDGTFLVAGAGDLQEFPPSERSSFLHFDHSFAHLGTFYPPHADGTTDPWGISEGWKVINDHQYMNRQANGDLIVSGRRGSLSNGYHAAINRISAEGEWISAFLPESPAYYDHPFFLNSSWEREDGRILFGMMEDFYAPVGWLTRNPTKIHVWELDPMLNPLCSLEVANGDELDVHYYPQRIKATSDGGFIVVGGRMLLSEPNPTLDYWAIKLGPDDCLAIGVEEHTALSAHLYPNPGNEGFTVLLNGPVVHVGALHLHDAQGRLVGTTPVQQSTARFGAQGLAPGVYLYRITDAEGQPRGSGKWVKE